MLFDRAEIVKGLWLSGNVWLDGPAKCSEIKRPGNFGPRSLDLEGSLLNFSAGARRRASHRDVVEELEERGNQAGYVSPGGGVQDLGYALALLRCTRPLSCSMALARLLALNSTGRVTREKTVVLAKE